MACKCSDKRTIKGHQVSSRSCLKQNDLKFDTYEGRKVVKVPVVMARADVVMNGSVIPVDEFVPEAWDGVPVTWGHPVEGDSFVSAQSPRVHEEWRVGRIFNTQVDGNALKAEAWLEIDRLEQLAPGFMESLSDMKGERAIDVSTGYFSQDEEAHGVLNGREYEMINRNLKPNHLAILVDEDGACSWADGCGLRANSKESVMKHVKLTAKQKQAAAELRTAIKAGRIKKDLLFTELGLVTNERGQDDDRRQIMADLISREESPYTPDDEQALMMMSDATLRRMRDDYLARKEQAEDDEEETIEGDAPAEETSEDETKDNAEDEKPSDNEEKKEMKDNAAALPKTRAELSGIIDKVVAAAVKKAMPKAVTINAKDIAKEVAGVIMTPELKAALALMTNQVKQRRTSLIDQIVANSAITKDAAEKMDDATLEVVAGGLLPPASYAGRPVSFTANEAEDENDEEIAAMTAHQNIRDELAERRDAKRRRA